MKLAVGLVVKGGKEFIDKWISCAEKIGDIILVVDNDADEKVKDILINHPKVKQYHIQKNMGRNMSRDYQKILEMAREEDCQWVWNIDVDDYIPTIILSEFIALLLNTPSQSIGFPCFEMRGDEKHYIMIPSPDEGGELKHAKLCHKCYKVLSHLKFDEKDEHGTAIPHNCIPGSLAPVPLQHFGHFTKELREKKRKQYILKKFKDKEELKAIWMEDDDSKIVIKEWNKSEVVKRFSK